MDIKIRQYAEEDVKETIAIWNEVVKEGIAFPQKETLTESTGDLFFKEQTFTGIAYDEEKKEIVGMYILHPNNIGRCGHICNASYACPKDMRDFISGNACKTLHVKWAKKLRLSHFTV